MLKFTITAGALAAEMKFLSGAVDRKARIEAFKHARIEAADGRVSVTTNDGDLSAAATFPADVAAPGCAAVPAEKLARLIAAIGKDTMVTVTQAETFVTVSYGRSRFRLSTLPPEDLPTMASPGEDAVKLPLSKDETTHLLRPAFAAGAEETRFYLKGLCLNGHGERASVATDGHLLTLATLPGVIDGPSITIPNKTVALLAKIIANVDDIRLRFDEKLIEVEAGNRRITSKLIDGTFPDYRRIIPAATRISCEVERAPLLEALDRIEAVAEHATPCVGLRWDADGLHLSLPYEADAATDLLPANIGKPGFFGVSPRELRTVLEEAFAKTEVIHIDAPDPLSPVRITDPADASLLVIAMPMRAPQ
jgi:DNA polymerase-3 subunit beta